MKYKRSVSDYFQEAKYWKKELTLIREIMLGFDLEEKLKWGMPVYCIKSKNILGIAEFKSYFGIWFYQGVFLSDPKKVLMNAQEGVTKAMRQWRFTNIKEVKKQVVRSYVEEAIKNFYQGKEVKPSPKPKLSMPAELVQELKKNKMLNTSFNKLSPSCQREYAEYIGDAKKEETRKRRVAKVVPMIADGLDLHHKYKKKK